MKDFNLPLKVDYALKNLTILAYKYKVITTQYLDMASRDSHDWALSLIHFVNCNFENWVFSGIF